MGKKYGPFPKMNLPDSEKDESWCEQVLDSVIHYMSFGSSPVTSGRYEDIRNYNLYNGEIRIDDFKYITEQYGTAYPARLVNYPIIAPKIDLLLGEEIKRPVESKVSTINKEATLRKEDYKVMLEMNKLLRDIHKKVEEETGVGIEMEGQDIEIPEDIDHHMRYTYKEAIEEAAQDGIDYITQKYALKDVFKNGFRDLLVTGKEFYRVTIRNGDPFVRRVDPRQVVYDGDIESEYLDNAWWVAEERMLSPNEILDIFHDDLSVEQVAEVYEMSSIHSLSQLSDYNSLFDWVDWEHGRGVKVKVITAEWKAIKQVNFKISENKYNPGQPFKKLLPDDYKRKKKDVIETKYVDDVWEATKIGGKILTRCRRRPNQIRSVDDVGATPLSYIGIIRNNHTGRNTSLVGQMRNIQMLYNIVMYHIELTIARAGGKAVVYDVSQMPSNIGMDMQTVMYHLKNDGVIPINSRDEGGQTASFNQFQQVDFTLSSSVQQLINLKLMLEDTAGMISGVTRQREGAIAQNEYVGNVQRSVVQSSTITESWFFVHNEVRKKVYERLCNLMKLAWNGGKRASFVLGDGSYNMLNIMPDVALQDYGVFVGDGGKDEAMKQTIQQLAQAALQNGNIGFLDVIKVLKADTMTEAEVVLEKGVETMQKMQQAEQQQAQELAQQQAQLQQTEQEAKMEIEKVKGQVDVEVAKINAESRVSSAEIAADASRDVTDAKIGGKLDEEYLKSTDKEEGEIKEEKDVTDQEKVMDSMVQTLKQ